MRWKSVKVLWNTQTIVNVANLARLRSQGSEVKLPQSHSRTQVTLFVANSNKTDSVEAPTGHPVKMHPTPSLHTPHLKLNIMVVSALADAPDSPTPATKQLPSSPLASKTEKKASKCVTTLSARFLAVTTTPLVHRRLKNTFAHAHNAGGAGGFVRSQGSHLTVS